MNRELLSANVKNFLRAQINSVGQMEILTLAVDAPEEEWTTQTINQQLRSTEALVARQLAAFTRAGLFIEIAGDPPRYLFQPRDATLQEAVTEAVQAYRTYPVLVIETIFKPDADSAQSFADAFRIRPPQKKP